MVEFYAAIGIEIKERTVETKYYRAMKKSPSNDGNEENKEETDTSAKLEKLEKKQHGGAREGAGRKPDPNNSDRAYEGYGASLLFANKIDKFSSDNNLFFQHCPI